MTHLGQNRWDGKGGKREKKERENEGEEEIEREKFYLLSKFLGDWMSVSGEARDKVLPCSESFKLRPKTRSFDKLQEVGVSLLLSLFLV